MGTRDKGRAFSANRWQRQLGEALHEVEREGEPEGVHQLRVCLARLRVWLWLGRHRALAGEARWLRRRAAPLRDLDVETALAGRKPTRAQKARRGRRLASLRAELAGERAQAFFEAVKHVDAPGRRVAHKRLLRLIRRALERGEALEGRWNDAGRLHALRQAVRRVRYGLECAEEEVEPIVALQAALGEAQDLALAVARKGGRLEPRLAHAQRRAHLAWPKARQALERHRRRLEKK